MGEECAAVESWTATIAGSSPSRLSRWCIAVSTSPAPSSGRPSPPPSAMGNGWLAVVWASSTGSSFCCCTGMEAAIAAVTAASAVSALPEFLKVGDGCRSVANVAPVTPRSRSTRSFPLDVGVDMGLCIAPGRRASDLHSGPTTHL